jgi:hypothetical protein
VESAQPESYDGKNQQKPMTRLKKTYPRHQIYLIISPSPNFLSNITFGMDLPSSTLRLILIMALLASLRVYHSTLFVVEHFGVDIPVHLVLRTKTVMVTDFAVVISM